MKNPENQKKVIRHLRRRRRLSRGGLIFSRLEFFDIDILFILFVNMFDESHRSPMATVTNLTK
jgi:hypothetical protein